MVVEDCRNAVRGPPAPARTLPVLGDATAGEQPLRDRAVPDRRPHAAERPAAGTSRSRSCAPKAQRRLEALVRSRRSPYLCKIEREGDFSIEAEMISACGYLGGDGVACTLHGRHRADGRTAKPDLCFEWPPKNQGLHPGCVFAPAPAAGCRDGPELRKCARNGRLAVFQDDSASRVPRRGSRIPLGTHGGPVTDELEQLYQSTYTAVVRFLYRKVWDAERAEDLAQEVFIRALAHRPEKPRAWVFAVAANLARDEARAAIRRRRHLTLLKGDPIAQPTLTPAADETVEHDEQMASVQEALNTLTSRDREILLLWDAGLSYPEIAAQTGLAVGAVGTTLARARRRLVDAHERQHIRTGTDVAHS